jgi:hypothetical protein
VKWNVCSLRWRHIAALLRSIWLKRIELVTSAPHRGELTGDWRPRLRRCG